MKIGIETFDITKDYFGIILVPVFPGNEMIPKYRESITTYEMGKPAKENPSGETNVIYELYNDGVSTGKLFYIETSALQGWALEGREVKPFPMKKYFSKTVERDSGVYFNNSVKIRKYPLNGDEKKYIPVETIDGIQFEIEQ